MKHKGSTLIELVMSMSAGSAVMLLAITLVHQTMLVTEISKHRSDNSRTLDQLAQIFRSDIHLASDVTAVDDTSLTIECFDGSTASYTAIDHAVVRKRKNGSEGDSFERYVLDGTATASFQLLPNPKRATLITVSETGTMERPTKPELVIVSVIGRWKSLEQKSAVAP